MVTNNAIEIGVIPISIMLHFQLSKMKLVLGCEYENELLETD